MSKLHTTRIAVVNKLSNTELRKDVENGKTFRVKCVQVESKRGGKPYYDLVDADEPKGTLD